MPKQTADENAILAALDKKGLGAATEKHKDDDVKYGSGGQLSCPVSGIAKLDSITFGQFQSGENKGESYVLFNGIALTPVSEVGKRVSKIMPLCAEKDRPNRNKDYPLKTFEERAAEAMNIYKILGGKDCTKGMTSGRDWKTVATALVASGIHFTFHTWMSKADREKLEKNPQHQPFINVEYDRNCPPPGEEAQQVSGGIQDDTGNSQDWEDLGTAADAQDGEAEAKLVAKAKELGIEAQVIEASSWLEGAKLIVAAMSGSGSSNDQSSDKKEEKVDWEPKEGEVYNLRLKSQGLKKVEPYTVTKVFAATLNVKRQSDEKTFKAIPWSSDDDGNVIDGNQIG